MIILEETWKRILIQNNLNYGKNMDLIKEIFMKNRGYVTEAPKEELVMLLFSGGINSTVLIDLCVRTWNCKVLLLYIRNGAANQTWEEQAVDFFYQFYKSRYPKNILDCVKLDVQIPLVMNKEYLDRNCQKIIGLPLQNSLLWNNAFTQMVYFSGKYRTNISNIARGFY